MNYRLLALVPLVAAVGGRATISAQTAAMNGKDSTVIVVEAIRYFTQELKPAVTVALSPDLVTVDARGQRLREPVSPVPASQMAAVRTANAGIVAVSTRDDAPKNCTVHQLGQGGETNICQFRDFSHLLTLGSLHVTGDTARVWIAYEGNLTQTRLTVSGSVTIHGRGDSGVGWILLVRSGAESWRAVAYRVLEFH